MMTLALPKRSRDQVQDGAAVPEAHAEEQSPPAFSDDQRPAKKVLSGKTVNAMSEDASQKPAPARRRSSRSMDATTTLQIKRSHEANQERAYVAASRRADRSLEARVQSARAASEIHKRRTGKGFKITEEIVLKEEMYEEEEDETPRPFRLLAAHLQTKSPYFNNRVNAFLTNRVAMATLNHQREVERMFAQQFPNAHQISQQLHQSIYYQSMQARDPQGQQQSPQQHQSGYASPDTTTPPPYPAQGGSAGFKDRRSSEPGMFQMPLYSADCAPPSRHGSLEYVYPSPQPSTHSDSSSTSQKPGNMAFANGHISPAATSGPGAAPALVDSPIGSHAMPQSRSFTSDLAPDARMLASIDMDDPLARVLMGNNGFGGFGQGMEARPMAPQTEQPSGLPYLSPSTYGEPSPTSVHLQSPQSPTFAAPSTEGGAGINPPFQRDLRLDAGGDRHAAFSAEAQLGQTTGAFSAGLVAPGPFTPGIGAGAGAGEGSGFPDNDTSWLEFLNTEDAEQSDVNLAQSMPPLGSLDQLLGC